MAVLVEALSVIVRRSSIEARFAGGWRGFLALVRNSTCCYDDCIARVGFMSPSDVRAFVGQLEDGGLVFLVGEEPRDLTVIDQYLGPTKPTTWVECATIELAACPGSTVVTARLSGDTSQALSVPDNWTYDESLSANGGMCPSAEIGKSLRFFRHERGVDVYHNMLTAKEVYIGRTGTVDGLSAEGWQDAALSQARAGHWQEAARAYGKLAEDERVKTVRPG